jgi:hypothetical protein
MTRATPASLRQAVGALVLMGVSLSACGGHPRSQTGTVAAAPAAPTDSSTATDPAGARLRAAGVIYVGGSEPTATVTLRRDTGPALQLRGNLTGELRRLSGARVEVWGTPAATGPGEGMSVNGYTVLDVDG